VFILSQVLNFDYEDGLSMALSHGVDFTEIEEMEWIIYGPLNVQELALALQTAPYFTYKAFTIYFTSTRDKIETFA
jgi:hypothetical protein